MTEEQRGKAIKVKCLFTDNDLGYTEGNVYDAVLYEDNAVDVPMNDLGIASMLFAGEYIVYDNEILEDEDDL